MFPKNFKSADGLTLQTYTTKPDNIRANVIVIHGLGDHSQSLPYQNLSKAFSQQGFAIYTFDLRGHGQSEGYRMFANSWEDILSDVKAFVQLVNQETGDKPLFLLGLSLGGLIALNYAEHYPMDLSGIIAIAPAVDSGGVPKVIKLLMPLLSRLMPKTAINPGLDLARISRDTAAAQEYTSDSQFQVNTTPRLAAHVLNRMGETQALASKLNLPLLILHGSEDTIVPAAGSATFFEKVASTDKQRLVYEGAYHNLFIEINKDKTFADIIGWINQRI